MLRRLHDLIGFLMALVCTLLCVVQAGQAQDPPAGEAQYTPQEVADRFLEVRARLDKPVDGLQKLPGELPRYQLGEPVFVHLDISNLSAGHEFELLEVAVDATYQREPAPYTRRGKQAVERLENGRRPYVPQAGWLVVRSSEGSEPIQRVLMANLLCDMTLNGEYEIKVRCRVRVLPIDKDAPGGFGPAKTVVKEVRLAGPLRLRIFHSLYQFEPMPKIVPLRTDP